MDECIAPNRPWSQEENAMLKRLVAEEDKTFTQAAEIINRQFGTAYSRNACIGRYSRMRDNGQAKELPINRRRLHRPGYARVSKPKTKITLPTISTRHTGNIEPSTRPTPAATVAHLPSMLNNGGPEGVSIADVTGCRFAISKNDATNHLFCNAQTRAGRSYCDKHHAVCWKQPKKGRKPNRYRNWLVPGFKGAV